MSYYIQDIERVIARLEEIRRFEGEDALPLNRRNVIANKWKSAAKMTMLFGGFQPQYPAQLSIDPAVFCDSFPYHVVFNQTMNVLHCGTKLQVGSYFMVIESRMHNERLNIMHIQERRPSIILSHTHTHIRVKLKQEQCRYLASTLQ